MTKENSNNLPREKLALSGAEKLTDAELITILLGSGTQAMNVFDLSQYILDESGSLTQLMDYELHELMDFPGIKAAKASILKAAFEIARRILERSAKENISADNPDRIYRNFSHRVRNIGHEEFWVLLLDVKLMVMRAERVSVGTLDQSIVHPREVFRPAIRWNAHSIIVFHNHPSGDEKPSKEDFRVTRRLMDCGEMLGIPLVDHLIFGASNYYSFRKDGRIE